MTTVEHQFTLSLSIAGAFIDDAARFTLNCSQNRWPSARYAVMGGAQASSTLADLRVQQLEKSGKKLSKAEIAELRKETEARYATTLDPRYGEARLWTDRIIEPEKTREALMLALEVAALNPEVGALRTGVYPS